MFFFDLPFSLALFSGRKEEWGISDETCSHTWTWWIPRRLTRLSFAILGVSCALYFHWTNGFNWRCWNLSSWLTSMFCSQIWFARSKLEVETAILGWSMANSNSCIQVYPWLKTLYIISFLWFWTSKKSDFHLLWQKPQSCCYTNEASQELA